MEQILTVKVFDVYDGTIIKPIKENLKTFEEAEAFVLAHDKKMYAEWLKASSLETENPKEFKHHRYIIYHMACKVALDDVITKMSFEDLCNEAFSYRAISVVEFKF